MTALWRHLVHRIFCSRSFMIEFEPGAMFLRCTECHYRSVGWKVGKQKGLDHGPRSDTKVATTTRAIPVRTVD